MGSVLMMINSHWKLERHPGALIYGVASWSYLFLGHIEQSIESMTEGMKLAKSANHANSIANNMFYECVLYKELGNIEKSRSSAADCMAYGEQHEIPAWLLWLVL